MQEVLVKIPSNQSKKLKIERFFDGVNLPNFEQKKRPVRYTSYTHKFIIKDTTEPISINLDNVPREVVPIEVMEEEVQKSYDKGFEDGQISETAVAKAEINNFVEKMRTLEGVTQEFDKQSNILLDSVYNSAVSLAQVIARNILKAETLDNFELIENRIQSVIEEVKGNKVISVRLHPETIEYIESSKKLNVVSDSKKVEIIPDDSLKLSDVIVNTDSGMLIAKVEEELNKLISKLEKDFKQERAKQIQNEIDDFEQSKGNDDWYISRYN